MTKLLSLSLSALALTAAPALAHVGTEALEQHLLEHLSIALAVALPLGYGLLRLIRRGGLHR